MTINELKRRDFFKVMGKGAVSAAAISLPSLANATPTSPTNMPSDHQTVDSPLDATEMANLIRDKKASPKEFVQEAIYKIRQTNDQVNAVVSECFDLALERANSFNPNSPFAGVPFLVKDCVDVVGLECTLGSKLNQGRKPNATSWFIRATQNAGLNTIGMTNIPEMMTLGCTQNSLYGATRNPWDLSRGVHSATGIFGFKPSRESLISGLTDGSTSEGLTHQSFMSRTVRDAALAVSVTEHHTKNDFETPFPRTPIGMVNASLNRQIKIGVTLKDIHGRLPDEDTLAAIRSTVSLLESLGHIVIEVEQPIQDGDVFMRNYMGVFGNKMASFAEQFDHLGMPLESMPDKVSDNVVYLARTMQARLKATPSLYIDSQERCRNFATNHNREFFKNIDIWLTPCANHVPLDIAYFDQKTHSGKEIWARSEKLMSYTPIENVAGNPAMSVPLYWNKQNLPVGSHFSAARGNDRLLFELAYQLEHAKPWANKKAPIAL